MATPRMERFKEYRKSMIKEDSAVLVKTDEEEKKSSSDRYETTSTLPMDEVMQAVTQEDREAVFVEKEKKRRVLRYIIPIAVVVVLVVGIVLFAVLVWR